MNVDKGLTNKIGWSLLGVILFLIILKYDLAILVFINSWRSPWLDSIMFFIEKLSMAWIVVVPLAVIMMEKRFGKLKNWGVSLLSTYAITLLIKLIVARDRPFTLGLNTPAELIDAKYSTWDFSFPSNHASTSMASLFFIPSGIMSISWMIISMVIMFSRVYFGLHYLSDVIAGAAIGLAISYLVSKHGNKLLEIKALDKFRYKRAKKR